MENGFDVEGYRHNLKQKRQSADEAVYEHRGERACPVCASAFGGLIHATSGLTIPGDRDGPVCVDVGSGGVVAFVH